MISLAFAVGSRIGWHQWISSSLRWWIHTRWRIWILFLTSIFHDCGLWGCETLFLCSEHWAGVFYVTWDFDWRFYLRICCGSAAGIGFMPIELFVSFKWSPCDVTCFSAQLKIQCFVSQRMTECWQAILTLKDPRSLFDRPSFVKPAILACIVPTHGRFHSLKGPMASC